MCETYRTAPPAPTEKAILSGKQFVALLTMLVASAVSGAGFSRMWHVCGAEYAFTGAWRMFAREVAVEVAKCHNMIVTAWLRPNTPAICPHERHKLTNPWMTSESATVTCLCEPESHR